MCPSILQVSPRGPEATSFLTLKVALACLVPAQNEVERAGVGCPDYNWSFPFSSYWLAATPCILFMPFFPPQLLPDLDLTSHLNYCLTLADYLLPAPAPGLLFPHLHTAVNTCPTGVEDVCARVGQLTKLCDWQKWSLSH